MEESGVISTGQAQTLLEVAPVTLPSTDYRLIPLTCGQFSKVDAKDYDWIVSMGSWYAQWNHHTQSYYAMKGEPRDGGSHHILQMHRVILGLNRGDRRQGEHANRATLNNRRGNLRIATPNQNRYNQKRRTDNQSGFKGVTLHKKSGLYMARIKKEGVSTFLGYRKTPEEAHQLYVTASAELHGEFGRTQ